MLKLKKEQSETERVKLHGGVVAESVTSTLSASSRSGVRSFTANPRVARRSASLSSVGEDQDHAPESCLFADERIRVFYAEIKSLINDCFHSLRDTVLDRYPDPAEQQKRYVKGLLFVAHQMNSTANCSEIHRVTNTFPRIAENYQRAMSRFAQYVIPQRYLHAGDIKCPSLESFLYELYRRVALSTELKTMRYFHMNYSEQEIFLKDILRISMSSCLESRKASNDERQEGTRAPAAGAPALMMLEDGCANAPDHVMPQDSVSNIHTTHRTGIARPLVAGPARTRTPAALPGQPPSEMPSAKVNAQVRQCDLSVILSAVSATDEHAPRHSDSSDSDESLSVFLRSRHEKQRHSRVKNKNLAARPCDPEGGVHAQTPPPLHPASKQPPPALSQTLRKKPSMPSQSQLQARAEADGSRSGDNTKEINLEIYSTPFNAASSRPLRHGSPSVASACSGVSVRSSTSARTQVTATGSQTMNDHGFTWRDAGGRQPSSTPSTIRSSRGGVQNLASTPSPVYRRGAWSQFGTVWESDHSAGAMSGEDEDIETSHTAGGRPSRRRVSSQQLAGPKSRAASQLADDEFVFFKESVLQWKSGEVRDPGHPQIPASEIVF